jgi:hypothetical protein
MGVNRFIKASNKIYENELEQIYWDKYYTGLLDFMLYNKKLTKTQQKQIVEELIRIELHKKELHSKLAKKLSKTEHWQSLKHYNENLKK